MSTKDLVTSMRWSDLSHMEIAVFLGMNLSAVRRLLDPRAEQLHELWRRRGA